MALHVEVARVYSAYDLPDDAHAWIKLDAKRKGLCYTSWLKKKSQLARMDMWNMVDQLT